MRKVIFVAALAVSAWGAMTLATPEPGQEEFETALETLNQVGAPKWQPNGEWILFTRTSTPDGPQHIYKIRADGSGLIAVTPEWYANPIWSPDGTMFACVGGTETTDIPCVLDVNGNHLRFLGNHPGFLGLEGWSPDGSMIAFTTRRGDGGPYVALMSNRGEELRFVCTGHSAAWHPSGRYLIVEDCSGGLYTNLYEVDVQTKRRRQVTFGSYNDSCARYSPDGEWIVFLSGGRWQEGTRGSEICLIRRDGSGLRVLPIDVDQSYAYTPADFSPDGQYLVFGRGKWVPTDLYICRVDGTGLRRLTHFYPDGQAKGQGALRVVKAAPVTKGQSRAFSAAKSAKPVQPAKPAKR